MATKTVLHLTITKIPINDIKTHKTKNKHGMEKLFRFCPPSNKLKRTKMLHVPQNINIRQDVNITQARIGHSFLTHVFLVKIQNIHYPSLPRSSKVQNTLSIPGFLDEALNKDNIIKF